MNKKLIYYFVFLIIVIIYLGPKATTIEYSYSDENTYLYMGKLVSEGFMPYKDFFLSHPPLQFFFLSIFYKIFGFNFLILKLLPTLFTIITAFFIFLITKRFNYPAALLAAVLFLFSYDSMRFSTYNMGVNLSLMFLMIGFYLFYNKKLFFISGLVFGLAGLTRFIALIPFAVILIYLLFKNKGLFLRFLGGFSLSFILPNIILILSLGSKYIVPVFKYHLLKPKTAGQRKFDIIFRMIKINLLLFLPALLFIFDKERMKIGLVALISGFYFLFLIALNKVFGYYFVLFFPFLAIIGGYSLINILERIKINKKILYSVLIIVVIFFSGNYAKNYIRYGYQDFNNAEEIAQFIKENSNADQEIFGDDSTVPLIALLADRNIALNFADSNNLRFRSKVDDINKVINRLNEVNVKFIIVYKENIGEATGIYGPSYLDEFNDYVKNDCEFVKLFSDQWYGREKVIEIYDCEK